MAEQTKAAGMAKSVREATSNEDFDLKNYTREQAFELVQTAFGTPIRRKDMIRITFMVGGGKEVRQKYSETLPKELTEALRAVNYSEDRGASCSLECQGTFKHQHDTDKNLKFLHVFPRIEVVEAAAADSGEFSLDDMSPEYLCTIAAFDTCQKMVESKAPSFLQKRKLLEPMKAMEARFKAMEEKLVRAEPLSASEQELYDESSLEGLTQKVQWIRSELERMVDNNLLTAAEQKAVQEECEKKLPELEAQLAKAVEAGKPNQAKALTSGIEKLKARMQQLRSATPIKHKGKNDDEINKLKKELAALAKIGQSKKLLDQNEVQKMLAMPGLEQRIARLEEEQRGWYQ